MISVFAFVAGLLIAWNVLEQPQWVADLVDKLPRRK